MKNLKIKSSLMIVLLAVLGIVTSCKKVEEQTQTATLIEQENEQAVSIMNTAIYSMALYNDSLEKAPTLADKHHYDAMFHNHDSLYTHHHTNYHHGDNTSS